MVAALAATALVAAAFTWNAATEAQDLADNAELAVANAEREAAELADRITSTEEQTQVRRDQVEVLGGMFEGGTATALGNVYLRAIAIGCQQPSRADAADLIRRAATDGVPQILASHAGWEAAIDHRGIDTAVAACEDEGG